MRYIDDVIVSHSFRYLVSIVAGLSSTIITVFAKTRTHYSIAAGIAGLAAFLAFLAAGLYQNTLNDYINIEVSFSDTFTEEDANPSRDPGFVALFGSFACFVVVAANNLTLRAEEGAAQVDNADGDDGGNGANAGGGGGGQNANGGIKVHVTGV